MSKTDHTNNNNKFAIVLILLCFSMIILSFAAVPIYNLFCKVTGFAGTPQQSNISSSIKSNKRIIVEFDANVKNDLPWRFRPMQRRVELTLGENNLIFYEAENISNRDIIGTSVYNVTPNKAGQYFVKIHCFCFEEQLLKAGEKVLMPVSFYIDPGLEVDPEMSDVNIITLSYSFFLVREL